jgi:hypothetical protein
MNSGGYFCNNCATCVNLFAFSHKDFAISWNYKISLGTPTGSFQKSVPFS